MTPSGQEDSVIPRWERRGYGIDVPLWSTTSNNARYTGEDILKIANQDGTILYKSNAYVYGEAIKLHERVMARGFTNAQMTHHPRVNQARWINITRSVSLRRLRAD
jgi:hypothetical protein